MKKLLPLLLLLLPVIGIAQVGIHELKQPGEKVVNNLDSLNTKTFDTFARKIFAYTATGKNDLPSLANFAAFDFKDKKLSFNGSGFLNNSWALSFNVAAESVNDNLGFLVSEGSLTSGTDVNLKVHHAIRKSKISFNTAEYVKVEAKRDKLVQERDAEIAGLQKNLKMASIYTEQSILKQTLTGIAIEKLKNDTIALAKAIIEKNKEIDLARSGEAKDKLYKEQQELTDSIIAVSIKLYESNEKIKKTGYELDSLIALVGILGIDTSVIDGMLSIDLASRIMSGRLFEYREDTIPRYGLLILKLLDTTKKKDAVDGQIISLLRKEKLFDRVKRSNMAPKVSDAEISKRIKEMANPAAIQEATKRQFAPGQATTMGIYNITYKTTYRDTLIRAVYSKYDSLIVDVEKMLPVNTLSITWVNLVVNGNNQSYRTYDSKLAFSDQIQKDAFFGYGFGAEINRYWFDKALKKCKYLNIGVFYKQSSNLDELSESTVTDEEDISNDNVKRKTSTAYTVYKDTIKSFSEIVPKVNFYIFKGKNLSNGFHLYSEASLRSNGDKIFDLGGGFVFGFNKKDDPKKLLNAELFITYKDLTRTLIDDLKTSNWEQFQVGVSITIPVFFK